MEQYASLSFMLKTGCNLFVLSFQAMLLPIAAIVWFIPVQGTDPKLLVYPRILEERSSDGRTLLHIHEGLTLNLRKASVVAPEFRVLDVEDGEQVTRLYNKEELEEYLYEDETLLATVHVVKKGSSHEVEGILGPDRRIQPMPSMERSADGIVAHMIFPIESKRMLDEAVVPSELGNSLLSARNIGPTDTVPEKVTVELFIVSCRRHHMHFKQTKHIMLYLMIMVNSVNMRYADTRAPNLQFVFTGLEKNTDDAFMSGYGDYIHSSFTLKNFQEYAEKKKKDHGNPDVSYLITGGDVYSVDSANKMETSTLGIGYVGGVCTTFSVAIGEDSAGYYTGMHTMAHEAAHVLGSEHDESPPASSIDGHPGSLSCLWATGNIMSYVNKGPQHHRFSRCSLEQMQFVMVLRGRVCWEVTRPGRRREGRYPGMEVSIDKFCQRQFPDKPNVTADLESPSLLQCKVKCQYTEISYETKQDGVYRVSSIYSRIVDALDYMYCGNEKVCMQGECITKPSPRTKRPGSAAKSKKPT